MRALILIAMLLMMLTACAHQKLTQSPDFIEGAQGITEAGAIAIVRTEILRRGGNPEGLEFSAGKSDVHSSEAKWIEAEMKKLKGPDYRLDEDWLVNATSVFYDASGAKRYVPGAYTSYFISLDGKILRVEGGR